MIKFDTGDRWKILRARTLTSEADVVVGKVE